MRRRCHPCSLSPLLLGAFGPLAGACHVAGGERSWAFDAALVEAVEVDFSNGDLVLLAEDTDQALVDWEGGGVGRDPGVHAELVDGLLRVGHACAGTCGGDLDLLVPAGVPLWVQLDFGDVDLELGARADVRACLSAGDLDLRVPAGGYRLQVDVDAGDQEVVGVFDDPLADAALSLCLGAGDLRLAGQ
jgi:hypothetical protein